MLLDQHSFNEAPRSSGNLLDHDPYLRLSDFPIPENVVAGGKGWSLLMNEMAEYIGARDVLRLCDAMGGVQVYFPIKNANGVLFPVLDEEKNRALSEIFGGTRLTLPTAKYAIAIARRAAVAALVRDGKLSVADGAVIAGIRRDAMSSLINHSEEGLGVEAGDIPVSRRLRAAREAAEIAATQMRKAACPPECVEQCRADIIAALAPAGRRKMLAELV